VSGASGVNVARRYRVGVLTIADALTTAAPPS
jgi:hypothetical protein